MHPDSMRIASIQCDLETLDYDMKQLEAESWRHISAGTPRFVVEQQFQASQKKLFEAFVSDLKYYLQHGVYPEKI